VCSLPLPLDALWGRAVGAVLFPRALSLCPTVPTCQPSLTSRPRSPRRGRAHDRAFSCHVLASVPLLSPAPYSPTSPRSFAPPAKPSRPLALPTHVESSATTHRRLLPVLRSPSRPRPVLCHGEFCITVSCSGHPSVCPSPLYFVQSALTGAILVQLEPRRRRPIVSLRLRHCPVTQRFPSR
jgi:hypothetical protein